jgi:SAM-dependent methyltransferase
MLNTELSPNGYSRLDAMANPPFSSLARYFDDRVTKYGHAPEACDWGSRESQWRRFQVLCDVCTLDGRTILDIGCGPAYLADYLEERAPTAKYTGYDISEKMVAAARGRRPGIDVRHGDILGLSPRPKADIVLASGIMFRLGEDPMKWFKYLVSGLFGCTERAFAFNCLSAWGTDREPGEFYPDPLEALAFCRTLSPWVCLRHDYHPRDFTVYLYTRENGCARR